MNISLTRFSPVSFSPGRLRARGSCLVVLLLLLGLTRALGHGGVELGPNGGRIVEFGKDGAMHGEVTLKDGMFRVALFDKEMKPVTINAQTLAVTGGDRRQPEKPKVEKVDGRFVFPALKGDTYLLVFQLREKPTDKAMIARFEYDASQCGACQQPEWLCKCPSEKEPKKGSGREPSRK